MREFRKNRFVEVLGLKKGEQIGMSNITIHVAEKKNGVTIHPALGDKLTKIIKESLAGARAAFNASKVSSVLGQDAPQAIRRVSTWPVTEDNVKFLVRSPLESTRDPPTQFGRIFLRRGNMT